MYATRGGRRLDLGEAQSEAAPGMPWPSEPLLVCLMLECGLPSRAHSTRHRMLKSAAPRDADLRVTVWRANSSDVVKEFAVSGRSRDAEQPAQVWCPMRHFGLTSAQGSESICVNINDETPGQPFKFPLFLQPSI